jgi:hypothetical protein
MMRIFILFPMQVMKVNMQCKKVNMGKYRVTSRRGFGDLSPPNRTSPLFILWVHHPIPEMVVLIFYPPLLALPCLQ